MKRVVPILVVACTTALLVLGVVFGDVGLVLQKAARVCLECIGIG